MKAISFYASKRDTVNFRLFPINDVLCIAWYYFRKCTNVVVLNVPKKTLYQKITRKWKGRTWFAIHSNLISVQILGSLWSTEYLWYPKTCTVQYCIIRKGQVINLYFSLNLTPHMKEEYNHCRNYCLERYDFYKEQHSIFYISRRSNFQKHVHVSYAMRTLNCNIKILIPSPRQKLNYWKDNIYGNYTLIKKETKRSS